jgi:predicted SprT family Zn-dependent metalloprotease
MNSLTAVKTGPLDWDFYQTARDEFVGSIALEILDAEKGKCELRWEVSEGIFEFEEYVEAYQQAISFAIFDLKLTSVHTVCKVDDTATRDFYETVGFLPGREFNDGKFRYLRFSCDRYDLVRKLAESLMGKHLDLEVWSFGFDSAKKRLGVCKYEESLIALSRYFVDLHSLAEIDQVMRHEIAHAMAGSKAGHSKKWKDIATRIGYTHIKISGDEIGNATAKLIGSCPNGHTVYRHRKPKSPLSCSKCSPRFDRRFLITWTIRQ